MGSLQRVFLVQGVFGQRPEQVRLGASMGNGIWAESNYGVPEAEERGCLRTIEETRAVQQIQEAEREEMRSKVEAALVRPLQGFGLRRGAGVSGPSCCCVGNRMWGPLLKRTPRIFGGHSPQGSGYTPGPSQGLSS